MEYLEDIQDYKKGEVAYDEYLENGKQSVEWDKLKKNEFRINLKSKIFKI